MFVSNTDAAFVLVAYHGRVLLENSVGKDSGRKCVFDELVSVIVGKALPEVAKLAVQPVATKIQTKLAVGNGLVVLQKTLRGRTHPPPVYSAV